MDRSIGFECANIVVGWLEISFGEMLLLMDI